MVDFFTQLETDLDNILADGFGRDVVYTPAGGSAVTIRGELVDIPREFDVGEVQLQSKEIGLWVASSDVAGVEYGDAMLVDSISYVVSHVMEPYDTGEQFLRLHEV